jgi:hypothetical protein
MSQRIILELLRELGGKGTTRQIEELAKKKYPDASLDQYVNDRLNKL